MLIFSPSDSQLDEELRFMRKNLNIPSPNSQSPKEPSPKARRPVLNPNASPLANRMARPPRFPEIFKEDEAGSDALEDDRIQSPTPVTRRKKHAVCIPSHTRAGTPIVFPSATPTTPDRSRYRRVISRVEQDSETHIAVAEWPGQLLSAVNTRAVDLLARPPRFGRHPLLREHPAPPSDRRRGAIPSLQ